MSAHAILRWNGDGFDPTTEPSSAAPIVVADSWLVVEGASLALNLHRERFLETAGAVAGLDAPARDASAFWDAAVAAIPREGEWFPRVELRETAGGGELLLRLRADPPRSRSVTLTTHDGPDPRVHPRIKGPSLERLEALRETARATGADDLVILDPLGHIAEGASNAIVWWRGDILCMPAQEIERVDSVTARALAALAVASGISISWETTAPTDLDGLEIWALNALHGPRIVTNWIDGPAPAEEPGRLATWRARLHALRRPLPAPAVGATA